MTDHSGQYFGRYYLAERLGEGGMAVVYKAYDTRLERDVAIKIIRREAFSEEALDEVLKRFEREAKSLAKLSHPNIVKVHDFGEHEGSPYLVMEYLPGGTLKKLLGEPIPWQYAVKLILPVARGVAYVHQRGVLHRDIKPANVLITESGEPMLSDFGIAKLLEGKQTTVLTESGMAIGTPEYMSPEQWTGTTSPFSDQYSLGVVLYEMVTGRKPYEADTPGAILIKQVTEPLPNPSKFISDLPYSVENILIKALAREPENRYKDVDAFIAALDGLDVNVPIAPTIEDEKVIQESQLSPHQELVISVPAEMPEQDAGETVGGIDIVDETKKGEEFPLSLKPIRQKPFPVKFSRRWIGMFFGGLVVALVAWLGLPMTKGWFAPLPEPTMTATIQIQASPTKSNVSAMATETLSPTVVPTRTLAPSLTPIPSDITDSKGVEMVLVSSVALFEMGGDGGDGDERPPHMVFLDNYYIDKYEVTNALYKMCVEAKACVPPTNTGRFNNPLYAQHPVVYVDWNMSRTFCEWRGARLPTEAEWEKAARSLNGGGYPWGWGENNTYADFKQEPGDTKPVGSYPQGVSPYGAYDMAGNVYEWVADWYSASYYAVSPARNPTGPESGEYRVLRGGTWCYDGKCQLASTIREGYAPSNSWNSVGFRCAKSVP